MMKEFIQTEKERLQKQLRWFNERGNRIWVDDLIDTMAAEFIVTRIAPHFDSHGNLLKSDFWLLWKELGYQESLRHAHTIKVVQCDVLDQLTINVDGEPVTAWLLVEFTDDLGRVHRVEMIEPGQEPHHAQDWKNWVKFKSDNAEMFEQLDRDILKEHTILAEEWQ